MAEDKKFPTPSMIKAQERWDRMTETEKEALLAKAREKLERRRHRFFLSELDPDE